jgi:elongation factor P
LSTAFCAPAPRRTGAPSLAQIDQATARTPRAITPPSLSSAVHLNYLGALRVKSTELKSNMGIKIDNKLYLITRLEHRTPGNLRAFIQVTIRDLNNGAILEKRLRSGEEVEQVDLDRRQMEYLYEQNGKFVFMDLESFDQVELPKEIIGDMPLYVLPNSQVVVLWCDGRPISIEMPMSVTLVVTDTAPGIKGATATNQLKEATCETGLKTRVPPFIVTGEKIIVGTEDGAYKERA